MLEDEADWEREVRMGAALRLELERLNSLRPRPRKVPTPLDLAGTEASFAPLESARLRCVAGLA